MKITQEDKARVLETIRRCQKPGVFQVSLEWAGEGLGLTDEKRKAVLKSLEADGKIRINGRRGARWCVPVVSDKRKQVFDSIDLGYRQDLETICSFTSLEPDDAVALCLALQAEGKCKIIDLTIQGYDPEDVEE